MKRRGVDAAGPAVYDYLVETVTTLAGYQRRIDPDADIPPSALERAFAARRPVVVAVWQLPDATGRSFGPDRMYEHVQVTGDGKVTLLRSIVFVGHHPASDDPTRPGLKHAVAYEPAPDGDTTDREITFAELPRYVDDPGNWSEAYQW
ncbi:MAG: hypothetical protein M3501_02110 [Actinomycetota bacterium]|nr:hypothetical protein [Actinomycetota bacterium]